jgi:hypothetical protein
VREVGENQAVLWQQCRNAYHFQIAAGLAIFARRAEIGAESMNLQGACFRQGVLRLVSSPLSAGPAPLRVLSHLHAVS